MHRLICLALLAPVAATAADDSFRFSGTARARYESLSGQPRLAFKEADQWVSLRTTLAAEYGTGPLRFAGEVQDSRAYLADRRSTISTNEVNALELTQAYVSADLGTPFGAGSALSAQAGRFTMNIGSRRLVAADDYRNTTSSVTGVKTDFKLAGGWSGNAYYTLPQTRLPDDLTSILDNAVRWDRESSAVVLYGATLLTPRRLAGGALETMLVQFRERDAPGRPTRDRDLTTLDLRWFRDPSAGHWDWEVEGALQTGSARTTTAASAPLKDVAADFLHLRFGYQWSTPWKPRLALDYDHVSGEDGGVKSRRFDTLFGMRRGDFAPSGLYNLVGRANIDSPGLRVEATPGPRVDLMATLRGLWLASRTDAFSTIGVRDASGRSGDYAGTQLDTRLRYWLVPKRLRLELDGIVLAKGRFLQHAPGTRDDGSVKYLSVNLQASF
jgi:hypothetical protein